MKKIFLVLVAALFTGIATADDRPIDYNQIPQAAKEFIAKHFANVKVLSATVDREFMDTEYTVYLQNGTKIDFNKSGAWKEVDCNMSEVPTAIIPERIASYVSANFAGMKILKIDIDRTDYEVKLSNGFDLKFDLQGNFLRMDD